MNPLLPVVCFFSSTPLRNVQTAVHCWLIYTPKPLQEITRVIIRMWFLQESAMRMNGLHESSSKLNIRSYPKAKKIDSDLILLLCPRAHCSGLSTFETLRCINHLRVYSAVKVTSSHGCFAGLLPHICPMFLWIFVNLATVAGGISISQKYTHNHMY